jgi:hypothetical protein
MLCSDGKKCSFARVVQSQGALGVTVGHKENEKVMRECNEGGVGDYIQA